MTAVVTEASHPAAEAASRAIEMVDLRSQYLAIKEEIDAAVQAVIDSGSFIRGPFVSDFERALAEKLDVPYVLGVGNGTDALQIAYMAAGVGPGDEVVTTAFSFIATAEAAVVLGARPVFVDIDPTTYNIDPEQLSAALSPRTKAVVPVHLFGQPAEMEPILDLAGRRGIAVIEDNAQAIGATIGGQATGTIGDLGTFSFFPSKNLGCYGDGGAVATRDPELYERVRMIANHGARKKYFNEVPGLNSRLDALQAAILRVKLGYLDTYTEARRLAADRYDTLLRGIDGLVVPFRAPGRTHVFHQYTIRILGGRRDAVGAFLRTRGIPNAVYYPECLHRLPVMRELAPTKRSLAHSEAASREVLSLPMHSELTEEQQERVAGALRDALAASSDE